MASLRFKELSFAEHKPRPVTFEDVFMKYGALAEIHKFVFDDERGLGQQALWNSPFNQNFSYIRNPTRSEAWYANADNLPQSYVVEQWVNNIDRDIPVHFDISVGVASFTSNVADQGIRVKLFITQNLVDPLGAGVEHGYVSNAEVEMVGFGVSFPVGGGANWISSKQIDKNEVPNHGIVRCMFYQSQYDLNNLTEITVILWYNNIMLGYTIYTGIPQTYVGNKMQVNQLEVPSGFIRIGKLSEICPVSSADPGEAFDGAIQRAIQDKYIKYFSRGDGSLRVTVPTIKYINDNNPAPADVGYPTQYVIQNYNLPSYLDDNGHYLDRLKSGNNGDGYNSVDGSWYQYESSNQFSIDYSQAISHVRMLGAFAWATEIDWWLVNAVGNRFAEIQNSAVFSAKATKDEAHKFLRRVREQIFKLVISTESIGFILAEPEDLVLYPGINKLKINRISDNSIINNAALWWIDSFTQDSVDGSSIKTTLNLRLNGFIDFLE